MTAKNIKNVKETTRLIDEEINDNITVQVACLECPVTNASHRKIPTEQLFTRCNIHVHSKRKRLADPDGISVKFVIDGLVKSNILRDDSCEFIEKISFSQEKINAKENPDAGEETIITIEET
jgi:hypothetical protein